MQETDYAGKSIRQSTIVMAPSTAYPATTVRLVSHILDAHRAAEQE